MKRVSAFVWIVSALMLTACATVPEPRSAGLDMIERALGTPAQDLGGSADQRDKLAGGIDQAFGLNGAAAVPQITELFSGEPAAGHGLMIYFKQAGVSTDEYIVMRRCLNLLSGQAPHVPDDTCGGEANYRRLAAAWAEARAKPVVEADSKLIAINRVFIDDRWRGVSRCAGPECTDAPVALEITHLGPNAYRVFLPDGTASDGFYDPVTLTLIAGTVAEGQAVTLMLHMSADGATVTGSVTNADGQTLRSLSLRRDGGRP